ncbi:MAG: hypothetical protein MUF41_02100 [Sphingopyxis sp.]|jgi:hypothetical protein|nr:hypothetical protein [Sphingopyxis sp.]
MSAKRQAMASAAVHAATDWTASGLTKTLKGFAERYKKQSQTPASFNSARRSVSFKLNWKIGAEPLSHGRQLASG